MKSQFKIRENVLVGAKRVPAKIVGQLGDTLYLVKIGQSLYHVQQIALHKV